LNRLIIPGRPLFFSFWAWVRGLVVFHSEWLQPWNLARQNAPRGRPFVTAAFALSTDGYLTAERGRPTPISSPEAMRLTHELRALHDAILIGRGTQQADDPLLTTRFGAGRTGVRVILDSKLQLSPTARLVTSNERPVLVMTTAQASLESEQQLTEAEVEIERLPATEAGVSLPATLAKLTARGITSVMVEGGATLLESFFSEGLIDFVCLTTSPLHLAGPLALPCGPRTRAALKQLSLSQTISAGRDAIVSGLLGASLEQGCGAR
jgi:riboflavin-specific deaminase-like protein